MQKLWSVLFGAVLLLALGLFLIAPSLGWGLPKNVALYAEKIDHLYYLILGLTGFFFVLCSVIFVYNLYCFGHQPGKKSQYSHGNHKLEVFWTAVPGGILVFLAFTQINTWNIFKLQSRMPTPDIVVETSARQFEWRFRYPNSNEMEQWLAHWDRPLPGSSKNGEQLAREWSTAPQANDIHTVNELHVWKQVKEGEKGENGRVRLYLKTRDVIHSFFQRELRVKQDALPGKTIPVWFAATEANTRRVGDQWEDGWRYDEAKKGWVKDPRNIWEIACAELCGWGHTRMKGRLYVHESRNDFLEWLKDAEKRQNAHTDR